MSVNLKKDYSHQTDFSLKDKDREEKIIDLLKKNIEIAEENKKMIKKINQWIFFQKIKGWFYIFLFVVPVVFAVFYLPPLLDDIFNQYGKIWKKVMKVDKQNITVELDKKQLEEIRNFCILNSKKEYKN